jgi:hypothetical protein
MATRRLRWAFLSAVFTYVGGEAPRTHPGGPRKAAVTRNWWVIPSWMTLGWWSSGWLVATRQWWGVMARVLAMKTRNWSWGLNHLEFLAPYHRRHGVDYDLIFSLIQKSILFEIIQKGGIFFSYRMNLALTLLVLWARKRGLAVLGPWGRCSLLALHDMYPRQRRGRRSGQV